MNQDDSKVVRLPGAAVLPENPIQLADQRLGYCQHQAIRVDEHEREIHCAGCGAALDPFDYLLLNAKTLQLAWRRYGEVREQTGDLAMRVTALKAEEQRIKARVRRLKEREPGLINTRGPE